MQRMVTIIAFFGVTLISGCAKKAPVEQTSPVVSPIITPNNVFVLLADAENQIGRITVSNSAGSMELTEEGMATRVTDASSSPTAPFQMDTEEINTLFGEALSAQPQPPFISIFYFETGGTSLTEESQREIANIIRVIKERSPADVSVIGHADATGSQELNDQLSRERAQAVASLLITGGVDASSIQITSHGRNNPAVRTPDGVAEPRNRRVEVSVR